MIHSEKWRINPYIGKGNTINVEYTVLIDKTF